MFCFGRDQSRAELSTAISVARSRRRRNFPNTALLPPVQNVTGNKAGAKPSALGQGVSISQSMVRFFSIRWPRPPSLSSCPLEIPFGRPSS